MIDCDKEEDLGIQVYYYYIGLMVLESSLDCQDSSYIFVDYALKGNDSLRFEQNSLSKNVWQVRCIANNTNEAIEVLKIFIGEYLLNNDIIYTVLSCQFAFEGMNHSNIDDCIDTVTSYQIESESRIIYDLIKDSNPRMFQWTKSIWQQIN